HFVTAITNLRDRVRSVLVRDATLPAPGALLAPHCERAYQEAMSGSRAELWRDLLLACHQREMPNSFSMSAIIGCVKPALRNSAKSSTMTRSHSLPSCSERGLPLWAR